MACAQLERDGRMLEHMKQVMSREIDVQVMVVQQLSADADSQRADDPPTSDSDADSDSDRQQLPHWLGELVVDPALSHANAPINNGVKHVQCRCGMLVSDESDIRALDSAHACMHAEHAMLTMQRLLLKL